MMQLTGKEKIKRLFETLKMTFYSTITANFYLKLLFDQLIIMILFFSI